MPEPRTASLVLVTRAGRLLGRLPPVPVATPWWQDAGPVVQAARAEFGIKPVILRLLHAEQPRPAGGLVVYLAEAREPLPGPAAARLRPWTGRLGDDPRRRRWASPGGPDADLAWASAVLRAGGLERAGPAEQIRTWNLSSIWRLPLRAGSAWLKAVPPFFAHEGDILRRLQGGPVPRLLGHDLDRILLADIPGEDRYDADLPELLDMVTQLVELQAAWVGRSDELLGIGLPDWRGPALAESVSSLLARRRGELPAADRAVLDAFVESLPARFAAIGSCRIPDSFVHGDFHPGNVRGIAGSLVLLDWGDCGVGHPMLDTAAFIDRIPAAAVDPVRDHWCAAWRRSIPGSDPDRAAALLAPVAAVRQALIYQVFLDGIEPSEHPYHRDDPPEWLGRAAALIRAEVPVAPSP